MNSSTLDGISLDPLLVHQMDCLRTLNRSAREPPSEAGKGSLGDQRSTVLPGKDKHFPCGTNKVERSRGVKTKNKQNKRETRQPILKRNLHKTLSVHPQCEEGSVSRPKNKKQITFDAFSEMEFHESLSNPHSWRPFLFVSK